MPGADAVRELSDPVTIACICPTYNRPQYHESLYKTFVSQDYEHKQLLIHDCSDTPSPTFFKMADPRVRYIHTPGRVSHGDARNTLLQMSQTSMAQVVAHFDDDDLYAPHYLTTMLARLRDEDADLVKLAIWNEVHEDGRKSQYNGFEAGQNNLWGWGFSYVYRRSVTRHATFPPRSGYGPYSEDFVFVCGLWDAGLATALVRDGEEFALHLAHGR
jgi:glycosyltransferase involved in cell wall biosynthesis